MESTPSQAELHIKGGAKKVSSSGPDGFWGVRAFGLGHFGRSKLFLLGLFLSIHLFGFLWGLYDALAACLLEAAGLTGRLACSEFWESLL